MFKPSTTNFLIEISQFSASGDDFNTYVINFVSFCIFTAPVIYAFPMHNLFVFNGISMFSIATE